MRLLALLAFAFTGSMLFAQDPERKPDQDPTKLGAQKQGEIRVYLYDKNKKSIDLKDVSVTVHLVFKGGATKDLNLQLVTPKGQGHETDPNKGIEKDKELDPTKKDQPIDKDKQDRPIERDKGLQDRPGIMERGEVREMEGGYLAELIVMPARGNLEDRKDRPLDKQPTDKQPADKTQPQDRTYPEDRGVGLKEGSSAYFCAAINLEWYNCGMAGHPVVEAPGKCTACFMDLKPVGLEFTADVIAKIKGETRKATGFKYPFAATKP